jgi:putative two-component system response regulator
VDEFKLFNDKYGHEAGDSLMRIFAEKLRKYKEINNCKTLVFSRMGGDEFAIFIGDIKSMERLKQFNKDLHAMMTNIELPNGTTYPCTVSIGISVEEKAKTSFAEMYKKTEQSLFDAKQTGKNNSKIYQEEKTHFKRMKKSLLIVDDDAEVRNELRALFEGECDIIEATDGVQAISIVSKQTEEIAPMLIDYDIPGLDGLAVLEHMRKNNYLKRIPVILIADENNVEICKTCYANGVTDIIMKPFEPFLVRSRVNNNMDLYYHKNNLEILVQEQTERINEQNLRTINTLGTVVEFRNMESGLHIMRVREFTRLLLKQVAVDCPEYGLDSARIKMIAEASPLHDVGKIAISDTILLKPGRLTAEEFEVMKTHTTKGYDIIKNMTDMDDGEYLQCCAEIARSHHEKYDGKGYPDGLKGDEIPISAQIVSVADVYDALISERCYKKAYLKNVAFEMILRGECGVFNPKIMESFAKLKDEFEMLADKLQ